MRRPGRWIRPLVGVLLLFLMRGSMALGQERRAATGPTTQEAAERAAADQAAGQSFLQLLVKGGWAMVPIAVASLIGLALILERVAALRRGRILPRKFLKRLEEFGVDRDAAWAYCRESESAAGRVAAAGLGRYLAGPAAAERAMEETGSREVQRLRRNIRMVYGISAVAPMLGLLGTVIGMIEAFRVTSVSRGLGKPELLATGIYEALVATMAGLMVSIPTLLAYYYFITKIEQAVGDLNDVAIQVLHQFFEPVKEKTAREMTKERHSQTVVTSPVR